MPAAVDDEGLSMMGHVFVPPEVDEPLDVRYTKVISVGALLRALSRRKLWVWTGLVGLLIGASLHTVLPPKYSANAKVYLVEPAGSDPVQAMANDVGLLGTRAVAARAMGILRTGGDPGTFAASYRGVSTATSIISITASGPTPAAARAKVDAVSHAFLAFRAAQYSSQVGLVDSGLQSEISALQADVQRLTGEISGASTTAGGAAGATSVSDLVNKRSNDEEQIVQLQSQIQQNTISTTALVDGSRVLDPGALSGKSVKRVVAMDGASGLIGGVGIGVIVVILSDLLSEGVRRRDLISRLLDAPVELSVGPVVPKRRKRRRARRLLKKPSPALVSMRRRLVEHLGRDFPGRLAVVEVEATEAAALAMLLAAAEVAADRTVVVIDSAAGRPLRRMVGARRIKEGPETQLQEVTVAGRRLLLHTLADDPLPGGPDYPDGAVILVLVSADPAIGCAHLESLARRAVVVVTAGRADPERLQATNQMLTGSGTTVDSVILVDADPDDRTVGLGRRTKWPHWGASGEDDLGSGEFVGG